MTWCVYILECRNKHLYTGISNDVDRRVKMHQKGAGARYTKIFGVKRLLYQEECGDQSSALKREAEIKSWPRVKKILLIKSKKKKMVYANPFD